MSPRHQSQPNITFSTADPEHAVVMCASGHAGVERLAEGEHPGPCLEPHCGLPRERMAEPSNAQLAVQIIGQRRDLSAHVAKTESGFAQLAAKTNTQTFILAAIGIIATIVAAFR